MSTIQRLLELLRHEGWRKGGTPGANAPVTIGPCCIMSGLTRVVRSSSQEHYEARMAIREAIEQGGGAYRSIVDFNDADETTFPHVVVVLTLADNIMRGAKS